MRIFSKRIQVQRFIMQQRKRHRVIQMCSMRNDCFIMFGKESAGIPEDILVNNQENCVRIPMIGDIRSLNLSNSVAIVLYEALRQHNFIHMNLEGHLRNYEWK